MTAEQEGPSPLNIRPASVVDLPAIESILRATIQTPYGSGNFGEDELAEVQMELDRLNKAFASADEGEVLLAENEKGHTVGFAFFGRSDPRLLEFTQSDPQSTMELRLLYLDPPSRREGVGTSLLESVEESARNMGMKKLELTSGPRFMSIGTGKFYENNGYSEIGIIRNYFEGQYPAWVFQKELL